MIAGVSVLSEVELGDGRPAGMMSDPLKVFSNLEDKLLLLASNSFTAMILRLILLSLTFCPGVDIKENVRVHKMKTVNIIET